MRARAFCIASLDLGFSHSLYLSRFDEPIHDVDDQAKRLAYICAENDKNVRVLRKNVTSKHEKRLKPWMVEWMHGFRLCGKVVSNTTIYICIYLRMIRIVLIFPHLQSF